MLCPPLIVGLMKTNSTDLAAVTSGKWRLDFVGLERVSEPLDHSIDAIMIPLSIALLAIIILVTVVLHFNE